MNILFISKDLAEVSLAVRLKQEGHNVKIYERGEYWAKRIKLPGIRFTSDWKKELKWIGSRGLIVFDDAGMGKEQDELRSDGFSVFGGCELGEKLEMSRQYGQRVFSAVGMQIASSVDFYDIDSMIEFIKKDKRKWVIKQNGTLNKGLNYVSQLESGDDAISILNNYKKSFKKKRVHFDLQEKIEGVEIAVGRFFNGSNWIGPICINIEHKNLFNNELGPKTHEMGTLMWYESNEKNKIYRETLLRMEPYLKRIGFKGYFDINCIINKKGIFPLEATARLGHPTAQLQDTLHISKWGDLMKAIADGKNFNLQCKKGFGVIAFIGVPPYPYEGFPENLSPCGVEIFFKEKLKDEEINRIYFEEVSFLKNANGDFKFVIAGDCGYVAHVSGFGRTILKARKNAYDLIGKIVIPKMFYRTDIGEAFYYKNLKKLRKWGWLDSSWWKFGF